MENQTNIHNSNDSEGSNGINSDSYNVCWCDKKILIQVNSVT